MVELSEGLLELIEGLKEELRPTDEELSKGLELFEEVKEVIESLPHIDCDFKVSLEGSFAKGTSLRGDIDLDVFILLKKEDLSSEWIKENIIEQILSSGLKKYQILMKYASHPYVTLRTQGFEVDVVPAYWAGDVREIMTPVDRTPFHTRYVNSKLDSGLRDEVRLLKRFMKNMNIYGAEVRFEGFSGYLTELLVIKYRSFIGVLEAMSKWREGEVVVVDVDALRNHLTLDDVKRVFRDDVLIVPDPVDPRRNAASAVSERTLKIAVVSACSFLQKPSKSFFYRELKPAEPAELARFIEETGRKIILLRYAIPHEIPPDVLWGELKRLSKRVVNLLKTYKLEVIDFDYWSDESTQALIAIDLERGGELPAYEIRLGPPGIGDELHSFIKKHRTSGRATAVWIARDGLPKAMIRRKYRGSEELLQATEVRQLSSKDLTLANVIKNCIDIPDDLKTNTEFMQWLTAFTFKTQPYVTDDV
ncbi:MAG: CCA tRNA nucleotidyltransferase [Zestosphaera sp.]